MMVYPPEGTAIRVSDVEIRRCESRRGSSSGEATQKYRGSLETVQRVDYWEIRDVRQDTRRAEMVPAARKFPNRSQSTGFCLGRQPVVWCLHPGRARPGLIEAPDRSFGGGFFSVASGARAPRPH